MLEQYFAAVCVEVPVILCLSAEWAMDVFMAVSEVGLNVGAILAIGVEDARY